MPRVPILPALLAVLVLSRAQAGEPPQLVLAVTVDQLRADLLDRFRHRFGPGGFRRLMDGGLHYTNAHYRHSTTFTAVGHATLFTGASPARHGIVGNDWMDGGRRVYCVEDARAAVLGEEARAHRGTGPANLVGSTWGDELVLASGGRSRVFSVSAKDRASILPAGHLGKAFWVSGRTGLVVTSTHYYKEAPAWVARWNAGRPAEAWRGRTWELLHQRKAYAEGERDDAPWEKPPGTLGRTFPHPLPAEGPLPAYLEMLGCTPMADALVADFVQTLLDEERPGQRGVTDVVAVSFSATDEVGHAFGPDSLEAEDNLLRLDRTLAALLAHAASKVERLLVVLSADHGTDSAPERRHALSCARLAGQPGWEPRSPGSLLLRRALPAGGTANCCGAGRLDPRELLESAGAALRRRFKTEEQLVAAFWNPSVYLDRAALRRAGLEAAAVEAALAEELQRAPGVAWAATRTDLLAGRLPRTVLHERLQRSFHPLRSGNVMLVQEPFWYLYHDPHAYAAMHGSPYAYDTHVPILIAGPGIPAGGIARAVGPEDIAPTLARLLGTPAPSGSSGELLREALR